MKVLRPIHQFISAEHVAKFDKYVVELAFVAELTQSGMSDAWIMRHIGMDRDELLRLKQISGLAALFRDREFSPAWEPLHDNP